MNHKRVRQLNTKNYIKGPIIYWMSRDQRVHDNWALLYAQELAKKHNVSFAVVFCLRPHFQYATERLISFMFGGLKEVEQTLKEKNIPFFFLLGDPDLEIASFVKEQNVGAVVSDFSPLNYNRLWKDKLVASLDVPLFEVDAHNIVPCWVASPKQEFGAYTLRPKIHYHLQEFLEAFPSVNKQTAFWPTRVFATKWEAIEKAVDVDTSVKAVSWIKPGENASDEMMQNFFERLNRYESERNDPTKNAQSNLSPYLHFGQIASQRIILELDVITAYPESKKAFIEELVVRKELSDNFCYYNKNYDNEKGFPDWAIKSLVQHKDDKRSLYSVEELEKGETADPLWNAAQIEMVKRGKMHGYLRMYWAKQLLLWTKSPADAQQVAIAFNDKYFLDGRDPNGYTGIAWSIGGVHDRAWFERAIFGKIRLMNLNGAKRKFDVTKYIEQIAQVK